MLVYGKCECFVIYMLYVCVLCAPCASPQCCLLYYVPIHIAPIAQLVSALDLVTSSEQVEGSILTAGKKLSLKNLNEIIRAIN